MVCDFHRSGVRKGDKIVAQTKGILGLAVLGIGVPCAAYAIPSPELIIGSASAVGQVFAVIAAVFSGLFATLASRLGFKLAGGENNTRRWRFLWLGLCAVLLLSVFANAWQFSTQHRAQEARLQSTLIRPASFDGTKIKDENLIETSFDDQQSLATSITTQQAYDLLNSADSANTQFVDIRETAEREMGGFPNSSHIRFPDIAQTAETFKDKTVILYCHNGNRSSETCAKLAGMGIDCRFIAGGIEKWIVEGRPFSDTSVRGLSDLRALPSYENKDVLISTPEFETHLRAQDIQIIDTRYPADFEAGHLPNAINIPLRALPTSDLKRLIDRLDQKPTIAACYDRRSCFMAQVLGWELSKAGIDFLGRYTTPWDYFVAPKPKPHIVAWQAVASQGYWQKSIDVLASALVFISQNTHFLLAIFGLSLISRLLVLSIAIKSDRDQIVLYQNDQELKALKHTLASDPIRKGRALKRFYATHGLTPMRNMSALLFLPVMMIGLAAVSKASSNFKGGWLWTDGYAMPDPAYILPIVFSLSAGIYFYWAIAKTKRAAIASFAIAVPVLFALTYQIAVAGQIYLCFSILLLFIQRLYVIQRHLIPLSRLDLLHESGNKSLRLSQMLQSGFPVPNAIVLNGPAIRCFQNGTDAERRKITDTIARFHNGKPCAVRSSARDEDGDSNSFAGIYDTVLNVDVADLSDAIQAVIASFSSDKSQRYVGQVAQTATGAGGGNIVIQEMVKPKYAGVLFTQDPQAAGLVMIEMVEGNGDDLVSGRVTPTTLRFGRYTGLADHDQPAPIEFSQLLALGRKAEILFCCPQDIEWTFDGDRFQIVQSRDITADAATSAHDRVRMQKWHDIFALNHGSDPDRILLYQDEMAEVLPRPTPMSFSIMKTIWAPGGSVDLAARSLGLVYDVSEGSAGHLVNLFGKLYSDPDAKKSNGVQVKKRDVARLHKRLSTVHSEFKRDILPNLTERVEFYQALDFHKLPKEQLVHQIDHLFQYFITEVYAFSEKVNILADFAHSDAMAYCKHNDVDASQELASPPRFSPSGLISQASGMKKHKRKVFLMDQMGHRSLFDYEIADPRYDETPDTLFRLAKRPQQVSQSTLGQHRPKPIAVAIAMQELKEEAKHTALQVFALLRNALLAFDALSDLKGRVFHLEIEDILDRGEDSTMTLSLKARDRALIDGQLAQYAPKGAKLSLRDCELCSDMKGLDQASAAGSISGSLVAGPATFSGRCYVVNEQQERSGAPLVGFSEGDVLVCKMIHPAWLENLLLSSAILSEVGGWLSHMAIVARERDKTMLVGCQGLGQLETGDEILRSQDGTIEVINSHDRVALGVKG